MKKTHDIVIIGAGPVGLFAAAFAAQCKLDVAMVDALPDVGGQLTALYPQKFIFDVAGYPKVTASGLVEELKKQLKRHDVPTYLNFKVAHLERTPEFTYKVTSEDGQYLFGKYVVIAAGAGMITPRKLELPEAEKYFGQGLEYVVRDTEEYRDQKILVIGGGDTALDWANFFAEMSKDVTLIHRSTKFVGFEGSLRKLEQTGCKIFVDTKLTAVDGDGKVEKASITNTREGWTKELEVDRILGCLGFTPKLGFVKECGFEIGEGSIKTDSRMRTNLDAVYAIGDISNHPGRIKLISTGFGNVQIAVNDILQLERERLLDAAEANLEKRPDHHA
jgi:thioredoxin reductase